MCCDGTLFTFANIDKDEKLDELFEAEIVEINHSRKIGFSLPCSYLNGCVCSIYNSEKPKRPLVCGKFKCKLLLKQEANQASFDEAILLIEKTKQMAKKNDSLLSETFPELSPLSTAKKIKALKTMLENAPDQFEFRKQFGSLLISSFVFEKWLNQHFVFSKKRTLLFNTLKSVLYF